MCFCEVGDDLRLCVYGCRVCMWCVEGLCCSCSCNCCCYMDSIVVVVSIIVVVIMVEFILYGLPILVRWEHVVVVIV